MSDNPNLIEDDEDDFALPRKKRDDDEMDITPMIDITFLLLIFFIVCSTMDPTKIGTIPEADNGLAIAAKNSAVIFINPGAGDEVILSRMDGSNFSTDEEIQATEIIEYITEELEKSLGASKQHVMLFGDANVKVGKVTRVQKIIGDAFEDLDSTYIAVKEQ
ncbi:MAG: biopolymer transporter ExbD [Rubripirellula sp.]|nr:biopolymer transporter ExbD [Rhodopirellula sp.]MAI72137.1 biopolymer transporter ExbD [Rhodopirellula sp.]MCH1438523.1 biopolymer transporter ExbD [Rubripirellula sp.]OUX08639.1 MAG: biopolymer transporter ExbD [Planctomycetaceae bacterium TMED240]OUX50390.1 MAG: biopolymer transporter ExbD [Rhodopirellula sp. TMED283]